MSKNKSQAILQEDIIESWYFEKEEDAREDNLTNSVGYVKLVNGIVKIQEGIITTGWVYVKSKTKVKQ